jgi:cellulose synthase/poly-beta-1,6-N-acetylglucosamine synthase-like glycosyltransferase
MFWVIQEDAKKSVDLIIASLLCFQSVLIVIPTSCYLVIHLSRTIKSGCSRLLRLCRTEKDSPPNLGTRLCAVKSNSLERRDKLKEPSEGTNDTLDLQMTPSSSNRVSGADISLYPALDAIVEVPAEKVKYFSLVFTAYLPAEEETILDTVTRALHDISYPNEHYQVILAYNSPEEIPKLESALVKMSTEYNNFRCVKVQGSSSKAENVNYVLNNVIDYKITDIVGIFDADQWLDPYALTLVSRDIKLKHEIVNGKDRVDVVQGVCCIRNKDAAFIARIVSAEVNALNGVSEFGRYATTKLCLFSGNGYWRASTLREVQMDKSMILESLDASLRGMKEHDIKIKYSQQVMSTNLAPTSFKMYYDQRVKWAQGSFQIFLSHINAFIKVKGIAKKISLLEMLLIREIFCFLSFFILANQIVKIIIDYARDNKNIKDAKVDLQELKVKTMSPEFNIAYLASIIVAASISSISLIWEGVRMKNVKNVLLLLLVSPFVLLFALFSTLTGHIYQLFHIDEWIIGSRY